MNRFFPSARSLTMLLLAATIVLGSSLYAQPGDDDDTPEPIDAVKKIDAAHQMIALGREVKSPEAIIAGAIILHKNPIFDLKGDSEGSDKVALTKPADLLKEALEMRPTDKALRTYINKLADEFTEGTRTVVGFQGGTFAINKGAKASHAVTFADGGGAVSVTSLAYEEITFVMVPKIVKGKPVPEKKEVRTKKQAVLTVSFVAPDGKILSKVTANPSASRDFVPPASPAGKYAVLVESPTIAGKYAITTKSAPVIIAKPALVPDPEPAKPNIDVAGLPKVALAQENVRDITHAPIPFKPFPMVDPKTDKPVKATDVVTLHSGRKVVAGEYFAHINEVEKKLNALGYSIRTMDRKAILHETIVNPDKRKKEEEEIEKGHVKHDPAKHKVPPTVESRKKKHDDAIKAGADVPRAIAASPKTATYSRTWNYQMGNPATFAAFVHGDFTLKGNTVGITLTGNANAGGYLMNSKKIILEGKGSLISNTDGKNDRCTFNVSVLGASIYNLDTTSPNFSVSKSFSKSVDVAASFQVQIGPVPITGKIGIRGTAGVDIFFGLRPTHASLHVTPHIEVNAYAQVGVGIRFASAGVEGSLLLIRDNMDLGAEVDLKFDASGRPFIQGHLYLQNTAKFLSGSIGLYVHVSTPWPFPDIDIHRTLYSWPGYSVTGYAFNDTMNFYLDK